MLGEFEQVVMLAVMRAGTDAYGVSIADEILSATGRSVLLASVYTTLARLETKGYVASRLGAKTAERGGRRKRYYTATAAGRRSVRSSLAALAQLARGLDLGLEPR